MAATTRDPETIPETKAAPKAVPPLENGDHLTRAEFERRYDAMPALKKAELIEGIVYMPSPVSFGRHAMPHSDTIGWLSYYRMSTPGVAAGDSGSIRLDLDNMPQPDAFLFILPVHGGEAHISEDDYVEGAPEFVVEVASSSVSFDLYAKLHVYRRNAVRDYVVWRVQDSAIDWFVLRGGKFDRLSLTPEGLYKSVVLPSLWLDPAALLRGDMAAVGRIAQQGVSSPEHADFVAQLQRAAQR